MFFIPVAHAQIYSHVESVSDTGGNYAGPGGMVVSGDAQSSVSVTNTGGEGSNSSIYIKTSANGTVHEETIEGTGTVDVSVHTTPQKSEVTVTKGNPPTVVRHETILAGTTTGAAGEASTSSPAGAASGLGAHILVAIQGFFETIFSWFK